MIVLLTAANRFAEDWPNPLKPAQIRATSQLAETKL